ncbi:MAG: class I SAM-dependent methyltransferase [bacterium]|nr:class I SAM-dependent methyltransferase [bacterium]
MSAFRLLLPLFFLASCRATDDIVVPVDESPVREGLNDSFLSDDLNVEEFVARFEGESREIAGSHDAVVAALELRPGTAVADIGAGTGLFEPAFSRGVEASGTVYAVDISPKFLEHLEARVAETGLTNVEIVACTEKSSELAPRSVDVVFVCDTYHHFTYPQTTLASLRAALRPGGRLFVVDFERIPGVTRQWLLDHVRAGKEVFLAEIEAAGFTFEREVDVEGLEENYMLQFRR